MDQVTLTQADSGKSIYVKPNSYITIRLGENPTTGYRWSVANVNTGILDLVTSDYAATPGTGVGGAGERTFTFRAVKAGTSPIQLKLWRDWEGDKSINQSFTATIQVQ